MSEVKRTVYAAKAVLRDRPVFVAWLAEDPHRLTVGRPSHTRKSVVLRATNGLEGGASRWRLVVYKGVMRASELAVTRAEQIIENEGEGKQ